jgi:hypothetical protein
MSAVHGLRRRFVDAPNSVGARKRAKRWALLAQIYPDLDQMSVIDLGGSVESWRRAPIRPKHVHVVNLEDFPGEIPDWAEVDNADACALPERIASRRYDLAFSNSVLEHVGGHERRMRFAESIRMLADRYWVQTPYRYFPVEPHYVAPGLQFLPLAMRQRYAQHWPLSHTKPPDRPTALNEVMWVELVDRTQMRFYFPECDLRQERIFGLTKSLIAVKA